MASIIGSGLDLRKGGPVFPAVAANPPHGDNSSHAV
jgi:hypothetical protein